MKREVLFIIALLCAVAQGAWSQNVVNLSTLTSDYVAQNGDVLTGTLETNGKNAIKMSIADNAQITLSNANILYGYDADMLGLKCEGNATIWLEGDNKIVASPGGCCIQAGPVGTTLTIKGNSIIFNNACISKMEQVVYVQVLVNPTTEKLVIRPCEGGARDSIRWCVVKDDKRKSRQITCGLFTAKLYEMMGWEQLYRYKMQGTRINYRGQHLYVFDLTSTEVFLPAVKDPDNPKAKARRNDAVYPMNWRDSFGIPVQEHESSMQIDLMEGFTFADVAQRPGTTLVDGQPLPDGTREQEQLPMEIIDQETGEVIRL